MTRGGLRPRLIHMLEAIAAIRRYLGGRSLDDYRADSMLRDAIERNVERLSETSRHIPPELKAAHPDLPWRQIAGIGNVLRHGYDGIDDLVMWRAVTTELAPLEAALEEMLRGLENA